MGLTFVTTVTHNEYVGFLSPHLATIEEFHPRDSVLVYYHDITLDRLETLQRRFPGMRFVPQEVERTESKAQTIGGKLRCFAEAVESLPEGSGVVFIDCDTLLCKPLNSFFVGEFDVCFTWKEDGFPLNSGVVLARSSERVSHFLQAWNGRTQAILRSASATRQARERFGAADQHALATLVSRQDPPEASLGSPVESRVAEYDGASERVVDGRRLRLRGVGCRFLNETNSCPISEDTHVIHYKSGWHRILLEGGSFHEARPEGDSRAMWMYWKGWQARAELTRAEAMLLSISESVPQRLARLDEDWVEGGILKSELALVCGVAEALGVRRIVESGRWGGYSTGVLSAYFAGSQMVIESVDYWRTEVGVACERRLRGRPNVRLYYGDAFKLLPALVGRGNEPVLLLLDGPKGRGAVGLIKKLMERYPHVVAAFLHDAYIGSEARLAVEETFPARAFSDLPGFVDRLWRLDEGIPVGEGHGGKCSGDPCRTRQPLSYGPTLALMLPPNGARGRSRFKWARGMIERVRFHVGRGEAMAKGRLRFVKRRLVGSGLIG